MPPTEKRGRVHTSTVTVAVLPLALADATKTVKIQDADVHTEWFSGTGKGGQHRNKHQNSCRLKHIPTGIVTTSQCRDRTSSYKNAYAELLHRIQTQHQNQTNHEISTMRSDMVGSGMRADKIRTYRFQDDRITDHNTGKTAKLGKVMKGNFSLLK